MNTGDLLYCRDGSAVTVRYSDEVHLIVEYQGKTYYRPATAIGETLFIFRDDAIECIENDTACKMQDCVEVYKTCSNCRKCGTQDCDHGGLRLCDSWASKFEIKGQEDWPEYMLGPYAR